jgi:hypothetical protein
MNLQIEPYLSQQEILPKTGQKLIAHYDDETIVVYQAYNRVIGHFAAAHGYFGGDFSYSRMSWMMFRSGWGTKPNQEVTLAIWLKRAPFDAILAQAVASTYDPAHYVNKQEWERKGKRTDVRLQWDPDHSPTGAPRQRRALQLGIRGETLQKYGREWIVRIEDISEFVAEQRRYATPDRYTELQIPVERIYPYSAP